jgi:iron complex outermembrane recepter protein
LQPLWPKRSSSSRGAFLPDQIGRTAEIIPVEPDQGNACAGKVGFNIFYTSLSQHFSQTIFSIKNLLKMKKMILGICYVLISQFVLAQRITGKVTDAANGKAIPFATVELNNVTTVVTNETGIFEFKKLKPGNYTIRISSVGYEQVTQTASAGNSTLEIKMERLNLFLQPVEIRAIRANEKAPFTKNNLTKKDIERLNLGQDLPFLLNETPSVVVNSDAGNGVGYTAIRIRGSDGARINVTLNGIPYNDAESQGSFFVDLPDISSSLNNIQVQRGVGTSSNGAGAFGATINLSTNEVNTKAYGEINNSYGSFNTWKHTVKAGSGLINDHFTIDARVSKISSDGYVDRASSDLKSFYLSAAYLAAKTSIRLNVLSGKERTYQSWYGISEADLKTNRTINYAGMEKPGDPYNNETDNFQQDHYQLFINHQFSSTLTANTAFFYTKGKGYYEEYKADEPYSKYGLPDFTAGTATITETDLIRQLWLDNNYYGQIFSVQNKTANDQLTIGGGWNRYDGKHYGKVIWAEQGIPDGYRWYNLEAYKTDVNTFVKYQHSLTANIDVFGDVQYRRVLYNIGGFRDNPSLLIRNTYNFFNPKVGISYTQNDYQLYASYSLGQKEPNRDDFEAGVTQQPKPEMMHDIEVGAEKKNSEYSIGATLYYMGYRDQLVVTGKINDVGSYTRTNVPNSYRMGIELQGGVRIASWLQTTGNVTLSNNRIRNFTEYYDDYDNGGQKSIDHGTTDIAFSPAVTGALNVTLLPVKDLEVSLLSKYVSRQFLDNTSNKQRSLNPYYVQNARAGYTLRNWLLREVGLVVQVNNVFNKKFEPNGYTYSYQSGGALVTENYYYPMAGINYMIGLNVKL